MAPKSLRRLSKTYIYKVFIPKLLCHTTENGVHRGDGMGSLCKSHIINCDLIIITFYGVFSIFFLYVVLVLVLCCLKQSIILNGTLSSSLHKTNSCCGKYFMHAPHPLTPLFNNWVVCGCGCVCGTDNSLINVRVNLVTKAGLNEREHKGILWQAALWRGWKTYWLWEADTLSWCDLMLQNLRKKILLLSTRQQNK